MQGEPAEIAVLDKAFVLKRLMRNADHEVGQVAIRALELLGKELGMFVQRSESLQTVYAVSDKPLTEEKWEAEYVTAH